MISATYRLRDLLVRDRSLDVPLRWTAPDDDRTIEVFCREVVDPARDGEDLPILVFLQGGPGGMSPRPMPHASSWITEAVRTHRVVLLDQRGTGRSTRVEAASIAGMSDAEAAAYLLCFRADSIVADLEHIRTHVYGGVRWQTLGQSFGGFLTLTYLSFHPEALSAALVTGGLTSVHPDADEVYRRTFPRVARKTAEYYRRYPGDADVVAAVADILDSEDVRLPSGDRLTTRRLQTIGNDLGMAEGSERMHWLFDEAFSAPGRLSASFLARVEGLTDYTANPLFAVLQESIYADGPGATGWAAQRVRDGLPAFEPSARPLVFTGEMFFPWMFDELASLRPFRGAAAVIAAQEEHTALYVDEVLAGNDVPIIALAYFDDMYVDVGFSQATAEAIPNTHLWVTNEYEHDGLRQEATIVRRLLDRLADEGGPR